MFCANDCLGYIYWTYNKWESDIWGWLEVRKSAMLHYTVNQRLHWACQQYGHSGRCQLCLQDISHSAKRHRQATVDHWVSLCVWNVVGWLIVYQDPGQYSKTICWSQIRWYLLQGGTLLWQVHSWKAGPGEVMTVENLFYLSLNCTEQQGNRKCTFGLLEVKPTWVGFVLH